MNAINNTEITDFTNSTIYVSLEPCTHFGKTPPCTDLIIKHKFKKVVIGMLDPNPLVAGKSLQKFKDAGIQVNYGYFEDELKWLNRTFIKNMKNKFPYIIAKFGQSIDGKIMTSTGKSKWITSEDSRKKAHQFRNEFDAIMVGKETAKNDNPKLNVRNVRNIKGRDPKRIIIDTKLSLDENLSIYSDDNSDLTYIVYNQNLANKEKEGRLLAKRIKLIDCELNKDNMLNIKSILPTLYNKHDIGSIIIEGGSQLLSYFVQQKLIDEFHIFIAPIIIGKGKSAFENYSIDNLSEAFKFDIKEIERIGDDIFITGVI